MITKYFKKFNKGGVLLLVLIVTLFVVSLGVFLSKNSRADARLVLQTSPSISVFADNLKPIYSNPAKLYSNAVRLNVSLIDVGVLDDGSMETPKDWNTGGWFSRGAKAGEPGNLVINGHYDNNLGKPAAFWELKNIKVGDKVYVLDELGKTYEYNVTQTFYVGIADPNRLQIFNQDRSKSEITLITCGGVWLASQHNYNQRLVVKGQLVE